MTTELKIGDLVKFKKKKHQRGRSFKSDWYNTTYRVVGFMPSKNSDPEFYCCLLEDLNGVPLVAQTGVVPLNGKMYEKFYTYRFELASVVELTDPIIKRIYYLYSKCKTTKHWVPQKCPNPT